MHNHLRSIVLLTSIIVAPPVAHGQSPVNMGVSTLRVSTGLFGGAAQTGTWLQTIAPATSYPLATPIMAIAPTGGVGAAAVFGQRTSDAGQSTFPVAQIFTYVDAMPNSNTHYPSWGLYNQSDLTSSIVGYHINEESSVYSLWPTVRKHPFGNSGYNSVGGTNNLRLDCGKGNNVSPTAQNCSTALEILNNGAGYATGILYASDALIPQADGLGEALSLAPLQAIKFHFSGPEPAWSIFYDGSGGVYGSKIELNDTGMNVNAPISATQFRATLFTPSSSTACTPGQFSDDANYHYVCTAPNTWKRVALSAF